MAATVSSNAAARPGGAFFNAAFIPVVIDANGATYATSSNGLPFDIAALLNSVSSAGSVNPSDVVGLLGITAAGYVPGQFTVGTVTYNESTDTSFNTKTTLATCPCTVQLWNGTTEFSDGACTQVITGWLVVQRGGSLNK